MLGNHVWARIGEIDGYGHGFHDCIGRGGGFLEIVVFEGFESVLVLGFGKEFSQISGFLKVHFRITQI